MKYGRLVILLLVLIPALVLAGEGKVVKVKDGDTVVISPIEGGEFYICRLYGIDAPERARNGKLGQPYGEEATKELKRLILGQIVQVTTTGAKSYDRKVCHISKGGQEINREMVRRGYAWAYVKYLKRPYASEYIDAEKEAREKKAGLWQDSNPLSPWEYRHGSNIQ